jgi:sugar phosphate isomerase/epimerase
MSKLNLSVVTTAFLGDIRQGVQTAARLGFAGVQCEVTSPELHLAELSVTGQREFQRLLSGVNQRLVALRMEFGAKGLMPGGDTDRRIEEADQAMHATRSLAADMLCIDLGRLPAAAAEKAKAARLISQDEAGLILIPQVPVVEEPPPASPSQADLAAVAQFDAALTELGARADRYSTLIALRSDLGSLVSLDQAMQRVKCPWFALDFDPVAVLQENEPIDTVFSQLGDSIRHVRGRDAIKGAGNRAQPASIGRGDTDWEQLLHLLDDADYRGWITIDPAGLPDPAAAAAAGGKYLRNKSSD